MKNRINAKPWSSLLVVKFGEMVTHQNGYYMNKTGVNSEITNSINWVYYGEVGRDNYFTKKNASNLTSEDVTAWIEKLNIQAPEGFMEESEWTSENLILAEKIQNIEIPQVNGLEEALETIESFDYNSEDESILIEKNLKNIENNVSLISEEFENYSTAIVVLSFEAIQILGVYDGGLKLNTNEYSIISPIRIELLNTRKYTIEPALCPNMIEIQYTHLKTDII